MRQKFSKKNNTTFGFSVRHHDIDVVVGDEKQSLFFPRLKVKKWNNEANFSIGLANTVGVARAGENKITFHTEEVVAIFEPNNNTRNLDNTAIRYIDCGKVDPIRISSLYELDRYHAWKKQTICVHRPAQLMIGYFGNFPKNHYVDPALIDIPECRISSWSSKPTDPMAGDESMWLIDIHYDTRRDDLNKMHKSMVAAIISVLAKYGINSVTGSNNFFKLFFTDQGKKVKFLSSGFFDGHYYLYINLGFDYHLAHKYLKKDLLPPTKDKFAYGLRSVRDVPDQAIEEIIQEYARNYGLPLQPDRFTAQEEHTLKYLDGILSDKEWIDNAKRSDVHMTNAWESEGEGINMDFEISSKPSSNVIELSLKSKNLLYFRQDEESDPRKVRPPRVVGSYAVYHAEDKKDNEYKTGKAFHIFRPWAEDATKNRVWCDLNIPTKDNGELTGENATLTIPQDFLDEATYPVYVDPTIGYESVGASTADPNYIRGTLYNTPNANIQINTIYAYFGWSSGSPSVSNYYRMGIYNATTNALIAQTTQGSNNSANGTNWFSLNITSPPDISANSQIYLCAAFNGYGDATYPLSDSIYYDFAPVTVTSKAGSYYSTTGGSFPATMTWSATETNKYSIYATYESAVTITEDTTRKNGVKVLPANFPK